jgi:hypothetical protein
MSPRLGDGKEQTHWSPTGHGIKTMLGQVSRNNADLSELPVVAGKSGTLPTVAEAFGSPCLPAEQEVLIGDLCAWELTNTRAVIVSV